MIRSLFLIALLLSGCAVCPDADPKKAWYKYDTRVECVPCRSTETLRHLQILAYNELLRIFEQFTCPNGNYACHRARFEDLGWTESFQDGYFDSVNEPG
jgi:hypothetical protein